MCPCVLELAVHGRHMLPVRAPTVLEYVSASQSVHVSSRVEREALYLPAGHNSHVSVPPTAIAPKSHIQKTALPD